MRSKGHRGKSYEAIWPRFAPYSAYHRPAASRFHYSHLTSSAVPMRSAIVCGRQSPLTSASSGALFPLPRRQLCHPNCPSKAVRLAVRLLGACCRWAECGSFEGYLLQLAVQVLE